MIKSRFIYDVLDLLLDGDDDGMLAQNQLPFLTDAEFEYSNEGLFVHFSYDDRIENHKIATEDLVLSGVLIQTDEYPIQADAAVFFADGKIDYLDIWCHYGDYPEKDLTRYTLTQLWDNDFPGRVITTEMQP